MGDKERTAKLAARLLQLTQGLVSTLPKPSLKGVCPVLHPLLESWIVGDDRSVSHQNTTVNGDERCL